MKNLFMAIALILILWTTPAIAGAKEVVHTPEAPAAIGPYSQGITAGNFVFTSGQIPIDPKTNAIPDGIEAQTHLVMKNLKAVLQAGGSDLEYIVKTTIFVQDLKDFATVNKLYATYFAKDFPARSTVQVARLPKDVLIEIEAVAVKK